MTPAVDVVIPTYNNVGDLRTCLDSLKNQALISGVFVCVDGSTDGTRDFLRETRFQFPLRTLEHRDHLNHGRAATRNLALPFLTAEFTLLLDSDMQLRSDAVARHAESLEKRPGTVSIGRVIFLNTAENLWARYQGTRGMNKAAQGSVIRPLDFVTANTALRTEDLVAVGGFDETLLGYGGEDTELGLRLAWERHVTFLFNGLAVASTVEDKTVAVGLRQLRAFAQTNLRAIRRRHPEGPAPFWIDHAESDRLADRLLRFLLNPLSDRVADVLLPRAPWSIQRRLLNYKVMRSVFAGYREKSA